MVRTQIDERGAIIAANDTDILQYNRDHYSYMWPRDGALIADAMSLAGYQSVIAPFFHFCGGTRRRKVICTISTIRTARSAPAGIPTSCKAYRGLPIQEDETALVLYALWKDYTRHQDIELPQALYSTLIRKASAFLCEYMELAFAAEAEL